MSHHVNVCCVCHTTTHHDGVETLLTHATPGSEHPPHPKPSLYAPELIIGQVHFAGIVARRVEILHIVAKPRGHLILTQTNVGHIGWVKVATCKDAWGTIKRLAKHVARVFRPSPARARDKVGNAGAIGGGAHRCELLTVLCQRVGFPNHLDWLLIGVFECQGGVDVAIRACGADGQVIGVLEDLALTSKRPGTCAFGDGCCVLVEMCLSSSVLVIPASSVKRRTIFVIDSFFIGASGCRFLYEWCRNGPVQCCDWYWCTSRNTTEAHCSTMSATSPLLQEGLDAADPNSWSMVLCWGVYAVYED